MRRKFTNPFGFVHSSDMIGRYTHTRKQANLFFPLFSFFFLFYTNSFLMKRRKKEFGLLNILGMGKKHIALVIFCETLILLLVSLVLGIGLGIRTAPRRGRRLCRPDKCCGFAEDF